jgi:hypothetical protein
MSTNEEKRLAANLERLHTIERDVGSDVKRERWHIEHTDRLKRETEELAKRLDK